MFASNGAISLNMSDFNHDNPFWGDSGNYQSHRLSTAKQKHLLLIVVRHTSPSQSEEQTSYAQQPNCAPFVYFSLQVHMDTIARTSDLCGCSTF